jgi:hypothetical protein
MPEKQDLIALVRSRIPLVVIETREELRILDVLRRVGLETGTLVYRWSVTEGLSKLGSGPVDPIGLEASEILRHIWSLKLPGIFALLDFHPYLTQTRPAPQGSLPGSRAVQADRGAREPRGGYPGGAQAVCGKT